MQNIDDIIEIKRGLRKVCELDIVNVIADLDKCEDFFKEIFVIYGLTYNTETLMQKRFFISKAAEYFLLKRLPKHSVSLKDGEYESSNAKKLKAPLADVIDTFFEIRNSSSSNEDFKKKYAEYFKEEVRDFSKEIAENLDESYSEFAKLMKKISTPKNKKD